MAKNEEGGCACFHVRETKGIIERTRGMKSCEADEKKQKKEEEKKKKKEETARFLTRSRRRIPFLNFHA